MSDPQGPWQQYGNDRGGDGHAPRHMRSARGPGAPRPYGIPPTGGYHRAGGDTTEEIAVTGGPDDTRTDLPTQPPGAAGRPAPDAYSPDNAYGTYSDEAYGAYGTDGDEGTRGTDRTDASYRVPGPAGRGDRGQARRVLDEAIWRYRSAPLRVRVVADVAAATLVLVLIVGVSLALRRDGSPQQAAAERPAASTTVTTTTLAPTTTTTLPPTTTTTVPPTTTTTEQPTTTTTEAPPAEPPPVTAPPTSEMRYRDCREAHFAGALPLYAGDPGYGPHLDSDSDGEACERSERSERWH